MEQIIYFVVFKPQEGQSKPAYSYLNKDHLQELVNQQGVEKAFVLPQGTIPSTEVTQYYLDLFLNGHPGHLL